MYINQGYLFYNTLPRVSNGTLTLMLNTINGALAGLTEELLPAH